MKVLVSAYSCEPGKGSERGVGWNVAREIARYHEVWVLTRPDESKTAIEAELALNPVPNLHFVYFTLPFWQDSLRWGQSGPMQLHYYLWQIQAYFVGKKLHQEVGFDLTHHVTFVRYSAPSFLSLLPIPFVWGPVGGGESAPLSFWKDFTWKNKLYEILRWGWRSMGELDIFTQLTAQNSAIAYATTEDTAKRIEKLGAPVVQIYSAIGLLTAEIEQLAQSPRLDTSPLRLIGIARLLHWKGLHLGLRAFAQANLADAEYWIVGDGPELDRLQALALELGISSQVKFWGLLPREEVLTKLGECSVLVHPSLHDSGAGVCLEAMAAEKPVICLDLGGPAVQVTTETGVKVPVDTPELAISKLAEAMVRLAGDPDLRLKMGRAGQQRVRECYNWEAKGKQLAQIYEQIVKGKASVQTSITLKIDP
ncbi:glycosyltransferase family 4 protein [Chamaesiphon polymorphus]|uniref:Glycosyl transferase family 1 n=1 Tax=Chamaesiphon polymorphus CCALA 037 TaxID=2107692 RepID=A0A2T1GMW0_9CYAN|nr:glycosyltransferase [Chamaesiphon polymorphus]PSB59249.1 glycosyl transferase family 1 [Chamaesiphon polymorphus CCALA 037]